MKGRRIDRVDRGIPPPLGRGRYPFGAMRVGDSFLVPSLSVKILKSVSQSASGYGRRHGCKFACRREKGGCRCWRLS